jgi:hypothetical protein
MRPLPRRPPPTQVGVAAAPVYGVAEIAMAANQLPKQPADGRGRHGEGAMRADGPTDRRLRITPASSPATP